MNGVAFSGSTTGVGGVTLAQSFSFASSTGVSAYSPAFNAVLSQALSGFAGNTIVVSNLTVGKTYSLEIFSPGDGFGDNITETFTDGTPTGNVEFGLPGNTGGLAFITDTFTAVTGGTETITLSNSSFVGGVSAINLRQAVPEPSTWAMLLLGLGGLAIAARRRQLLS